MLHPRQRYMFWLLAAFLAIGLVYPVIGLSALICMLAPLIVATTKGRYWCGNFCPRGSFYDNVAAKFSPQKPIPAFFRRKSWRLFMIGLIMFMFTVQLYFAWGDLKALGSVFIRLILITTLAGLILALFFHQRTWCAFCPIGTLASWLSKDKQPLTVAEGCVNCKLCTKVCPLQLSPHTAKGGTFTDPDCLKCGRCVARCPRQVLSFKY